jgi:valyl-tRNA synthetase
MGIIADESAGHNRPYDESKLVGARNFCNKLWNIARYVSDLQQNNVTEPKPITAADHWVLHILQQSTEKIAHSLENYRFAEAYEVLYHTVWDDVADWYIEASKTSTNESVLSYVLETILKLAHPFAPFVTETIWQTLVKENEPLLITASWPKGVQYDAALAKEFKEVQAIVTELRQLTTTLKLKKPMLYYQNSEFVQKNAGLIQRLAKLAAVTQGELQDGIQLTRTEHQPKLMVDEADIRAFIERISVDIEKQAERIAALQGRLANTSYVANAPKQLVEETRSQLLEAEKMHASMQAELATFTPTRSLLGHAASL